MLAPRIAGLFVRTPRSTLVIVSTRVDARRAKCVVDVAAALSRKRREGFRIIWRADVEKILAAADTKMTGRSQ